MNTVSKLAIAAMAGLLVASFASQVSAQDAARDAAIHKCIMQAQAQWPRCLQPGEPAQPHRCLQVVHAGGGPASLGRPRHGPSRARFATRGAFLPSASEDAR